MWTRRALMIIVAAGCTHASKVPPPTGDLVVDQVDASGLALDGTFLYWTSLDGTVTKLPLDGSTDAITLVSGIQSRPVGIAIDSQFVYWTDLGSLTAGNDGGVMKVPIAGGPPVALATGYQAGLIALDTNTVFFADLWSVRAISKLGGASETLVSTGGFLAEIGAVAIDGSYIYWNANGPSRQPLAGGAAIGWNALGFEGPGSVAVDATNVYWTVGPPVCDVKPCPVNHQGYVMTAPLAGGAPTMLASFTTPSYPVTPLAVDASHLYWMAADSVQRIALAGGPVETLASHQGDPHALVLGDSVVYWASGPVGEWPAAIRSVAK